MNRTQVCSSRRGKSLWTWGSSASSKRTLEQSKHAYFRVLPFRNFDDGKASKFYPQYLITCKRHWPFDWLYKLATLVQVPSTPDRTWIFVDGLSRPPKSAQPKDGTKTPMVRRALLSMLVVFKRQIGTIEHTILLYKIHQKSSNIG